MVMETSPPYGDPRIVLAGRWLTKRRSILLAPLFTATLVSARWASHPWLECVQDVTGFLCLLVGTRVRLVAASYHDSSHHAEPITAGPYAWIRHPLYLSNFLLGLGIVLIAGWWPMVLFYCLFFLPIHIVIAKAEEVHLTRLYGQRYEDYCRAVPALVPWRRYRGTRYGSRSEYKLQKGQERLKVAGYLAGITGILLVKYLHDVFKIGVLRPLSPTLWAFGLITAGLAVVLRPKTRSRFARACQTVVAVVSILALVIHLPGVLETRHPAAPADAPKRASPAVISVSGNSVGSDRERNPAPTPRLPHIVKKFWNQLEVLSGASAFGIVTLMGQEREKDGLRLSHEAHEAGQAALLVAIITSLWKQWRHGLMGGMNVSSEEVWQLQVRPELDQEGISILASFKRKF